MDIKATELVKGDVINLWPIKHLLPYKEKYDLEMSTGSMLGEVHFANLTPEGKVQIAIKVRGLSPDAHFTFMVSGDETIDIFEKRGDE